MPGKRPDPEELAGTHWDLIVVGGGITGAGVLLMAARLGLKVLLVEQRDFAWGTSSRSSKMVHGGLRYIAQGDIRLTRDALRERERLIRELPELVVRQTYLFPIRRKRFPGRWSMKVLLWLYDRLAGIRDHRWLGRSAVLQRLPGFAPGGLKGAMSYTDALTDDSRLVMRILHEGAARGGRVCNYLTAETVTATDAGFRVAVTNGCDGSRHDLGATSVINATGAWADQLAGGDQARIRPLRGSHLFVPHERLPVDDCLTILHPRDGRPVFIFPWEGVTCLGTTDLDHGRDLNEEPQCSPEELNYLLELANSQFPKLNLARADVISTWAGVRPVISSGKGLDPSQEKREHEVWANDGVITVSGGKLTTFRLIALDALQAAGLLSAEGHAEQRRSRETLFQPRDLHPGGGHPLRGWPALNEPEWLAWILEHEMVVHLDDLLLRRTHLGLLSHEGARAQLDAVRVPCQRLLGWDDARWHRELERYNKIIERYYSVPGGWA